MKILHLLSSPHLGGAEYMCLHLMAEQRRQGHDARLFLLSAGQVENAARERFLPVELANVGAMNAGGRRAFRGRAGKALQQLVTEFNPALVHSHVPLMHLLCARADLSVPWVATVHGSWRQFGYAPETVARPYLRGYLMLRHALGNFLTLRHASGIVAPSDYVKRELRACGIPAHRVTVILNGLLPLVQTPSRENARRKFNFVGQQLVIGAMGYFSPVKGFDLLVEAFARLARQHPNAILCVAGGDVLGDSETRIALERQIAKTGLNERIHLLPPQNLPSDFLAALDVFVMPSRTEGLPLALLEAMQNGLPSVVTSAGGCIEAARPEREALVFRSGNAQDLSNQIDHLLRDTALRAKLGKAACARAQTELTLENCAAEYLRFYQTCLN